MLLFYNGTRNGVGRYEARDLKRSGGRERMLRGEGKERTRATGVD